MSYARRFVAVLIALVAVTYIVNNGIPASATTVSYTSTVTVPAPPSSNFAGAGGGGDGWAVSLTSTQIFNVFHHNGSTLGVMCHNQADASTCWSSYKIITDNSSNNFTTPAEPGLYVEQSSGHLLTMATRRSDGTAGVVCIDTTQPAGNTNPFCGFTALSAAGDANTSGYSALTNPVLIGTKWYAFNAITGAATGTRNKVLCYDLQTDAPCASQPYALNFGGGTVAVSLPSPASAAVGTKVVYQIQTNTGNKLSCFDTTTNTDCSGTWPVAVSSVAGAPFPTLDTNGGVTGFCRPVTSIPCYDLTGATATTPSSLSSAVTPNFVWNGEAVTIGKRIYVPNGNSNSIRCYDFATGAACTNFPHTFTGLSSLYTVNRDPQRPTCLWVNADSGASQIQNVDAYTGGSCGSAPTRVASSSVINNACAPLSWTSLKVLSPTPSDYTSGTVDFSDDNGNPISGFSTHSLDANGVADLSDLNITASNDLPQFAVALAGQTGTPGSVQVKLIWTGTYQPSCVTNDNTVTTATAPDPPTGVTLTGSAGAVTVDWTTPSSDGFSPLTAYTVTAMDGGTTVGTCTTTPPATGCTISGLTDNKSYSFSVTATNAVGTSTATTTSGLAGVPIPTTTTVPAEPASPQVPTGGSTAATPSGQGYWALTPGGTLSNHGDAPDLGSENGKSLNAPIIAINSTTSGQGYWLAGSDGGVFAFGDAPFFGSAADIKLNKPVVALSRTPDNNGYWLSASDGGVFTYGNAGFFGSMGDTKLNQQIVGMVPTPSGHGYWLAGADGGVFAFGDAQFFGSMGSLNLNKHIVGIAAPPDGHGYWLVASDGGVFAFGDAQFYGSLGATGSTPIVGMVANGNVGYRLIEPDGTAHPFGTVS